MKSKTKKRLIAFMLCMVLVLSSAISAFADDLDTQAQDQTTTMADEPVATSMDDSTDEQQPVAEAEENQEQAVETQEEQQTEENVSEEPTTEDSSAVAEQEAIEKESDVSIQTTVNGTTITMSGPHSSFPEGTTYEISASELNENETKDVEIALKKKEDENNIKIATYKAYDIKLLVDGVESQPTGDVNVKFEGGEVTENITDSEKVDVYHVDEHNQVANTVTETATTETVTMTTNHFSTYVITTTTDAGVKITVQHYLQNPKKQLYRDSTVHLAKGQEIKDLSSPINYKAEKVVKINTNGSEGDELNGDKVITEDQTYRVYYSATTGNSDESVQMFDYQVKGNNNASINNEGNYNTASTKTTRFASGLTGFDGSGWNRKNKQYSENSYDTTIKVNGSNIYINTWDQDSNGKTVNHVNGKVFGNGNAATGIITGVNFDTGALIMGKNSSNQQMYEPGFFTTEQKSGKQILSGYKLNFNRNGDTYTLTDVKKDGNSVLNNNYTTEGYNFFPLDSIKSDYPDSANDDAHNDFFGMRYDIEFKIGDYLGDLNYSFTGDDDLWAVLDAKDSSTGGKVVIDLGGIHSALEKKVDLWKVILNKDDYSIEDKLALSEQERNKTHTLTILYMERGADASNCKMDFTLPNSKVINSVEAPKSLTFTKTSTSGTTLPGATFTLYNSDGTTVKDTATSDNNGSVRFDNLYSGTYIIKETAAPSGYIASKDTWTVEVGVSDVKMYKTGDSSKTAVTTIQNSSEHEEAVARLESSKTVEITDYSKREYRINLTASTTGKSADEEAQAASVILVLDESSSMTDYPKSLSDIKTAAISFVNTLRNASPKSEIAVSWYRGSEDGGTNYTVTDGNFINIESENNYNNIIGQINAGETSDKQSGTPMGKALEKAYAKLSSAHYSNKYVILFTDGMPGYWSDNNKKNCNVAKNAYTNATNIKNTATLFTVGYSLDENESFYWNPNEKDSHKDHIETSATDFLEKYIATTATNGKQYAYTTDDSAGLQATFENLAGSIGSLYSIQPERIVDVIDSRFELTKKQKATFDAYNKAHETETPVNKIEYIVNNNGTTTITWYGKAAFIGNKEATDPTKGPWSATVDIVAKSDFIGGNTIPTNGAASGIYVDANTTKLFPQPSVNVRLFTPSIDSKEITFYKGEEITSSTFTKELLDSYKLTGDLEQAVTLKLGQHGIPELTTEEINSLKPNQTITKDYSYPGTEDVVGTFKFEFIPDEKGTNGNHTATITGNTVETYTLKVTFIPKTPVERQTILVGKSILSPQQDTKTIQDSRKGEIKDIPKGSYNVTEVEKQGIYKVNVFAIYKQSTSTNPDTKEHPKLAGAKFSLTGTKSKNVYYGLSDDTGLVKWYADENCSTPILFNKWVTDSYTFKEIKAPEGYSLNPTQWTITKTSGTNIVSKVEITGEDSTPTNCTYYFNNTPLYSLPSTGGTGIYLYMIGGMMLMLIAVWILYKNKCREVLER